MNVAKIINELGLTRVAIACHVAKPTVHRWKVNDRLPRTDYTGETCYAEKIAALHGGIKPEDLLNKAA